MRAVGFVVLVSFFSACPRAVVPPRDAIDVLVIAPHPDDEVLLAGGVMQQAVEAGQQVHVVIMTNGDSSCERDGYLREAESVAALKFLGVPERNVHFLGYPDGALEKLRAEPLEPIEHRDANGQCVARNGTYADRSAGRLDEHTARTGAPAEWTSTALVGDLEAVLRRLAPRHVYLPHGIDEHPDHAMTYVFFRRALDQISEFAPVVHRGLVHRGECWPSDCATFAGAGLPIPPLPAPLEGYSPNERVGIDGARKLEAIRKYSSQYSDWLGSFARKEEVFWVERMKREGGRWVAERVPSGGFVESDSWKAEGFAGVTVGTAAQR